jgi:hypothetical protein
LKEILHFLGEVDPSLAPDRYSTDDKDDHAQSDDQ